MFFFIIYRNVSYCIKISQNISECIIISIMLSSMCKKTVDWFIHGYLVYSNESLALTEIPLELSI